MGSLLSAGYVRRPVRALSRREPRRRRRDLELGRENFGLEERRLLSVRDLVPAQAAWVESVSARPPVLIARSDEGRISRGTDAQSACGVGYTGIRELRLPRPHGSTGASVYLDIGYAQIGGQSLTLDVHVPKGSPPPGGWPVIVAIHGGGWRRLDKRDYGDRIASAFVPNGYVVVAPNYPLSAPGRPTWPSNLQAVQAAVAWTRLHASQFNIDSGRIVAMGESAGGNMANLLGTSSGVNGVDSMARVNAVVAFSSPTDLVSLFNESPAVSKAVAQFLGGSPSSVPDNYWAASPVDQVNSSDPPTLLITGGSDPLVPASQSQEMAAALTAAGVRNQLIEIPGAGHDLRFPVRTPQNLVFQILEFLQATWKDRFHQSLIY